VVYFEAPERVVVGSSAKNAAVLAPHLVASLVKRDMGRQDVTYTYHDREYTPEEISALVLRELAQATQESTGLTAKDVVITVPADFGIAAREATRRAGTIAGLNVLDVLAEPVGAALHYQALDRGRGVRHMLVCDLGGGTFDTSVIRIEDNDVTVICTTGDRSLGGADWAQQHPDPAHRPAVRRRRGQGRADQGPAGADDRRLAGPGRRHHSSHRRAGQEQGR
jgi:molecular chaperone DnaK (HSP70)